ncbi:acyltransferase [uncultured Corynebacterium sp.]|uniref:acyltransferase family protein n=1 Tax=uncultured Corynebacterium sp. TaxID=159447 RepID=UPI00262AC503|nr:acyltransferase [uncultured Corynebacterium sp.]
MIDLVHTPRRPQLPSLTGARWWAALCVFVLHSLVFLQVYPFQKSELFATIHRFIPMQLGSAGVTFFFILSGFLIYWSNSHIRSVNEVARYLLRRVAKIYPTHLLSLCLFVAASATVTAHGVSLVLDFSRLELWLPNALLIHTWRPEWATLGGMNTPSWSLASEMLFYLSFPLFVPLFRKVHGRGNWIGLAGTYLASISLLTCVHLFAPGYKDTENFFVPRLWKGDISPIAEFHASEIFFEQPEIPVDMTYFLAYYFPVTRLLDFFLGVFAAKLIIERQWRNTRLAWPMILLLAGYAATWHLPVAFKMSVTMSLPMAFVIATLAARDLAGVSGFIGSKRSVFFGDISFAFYMVQFPVMVAMQRYVIAGGMYGFLGWLGFALLALVLSIALAWAVFRLVDAPLMSLVSSRSPRIAAHFCTDVAVLFTTAGAKQGSMIR